MRKIILKSTLVVTAVAFSCFGAWKTYQCFDTEYDSFLDENLLAIGENVPNGQVYVRVFYRPCYFDEIVGQRTVPDPNNTMGQGSSYTEYHHKQTTKYYQVCVMKSYTEAVNFNLCEEGKATGKLWCTSNGGDTEPLSNPDYWSI